MKLNTGSKVFIVDFLDNFVRNLFELCVSSYLGFAGIAWYSPVKLDKSRRKKKNRRFENWNCCLLVPTVYYSKNP